MANTTIYDVAGAAKVSLATVSRVMNNPEKVNPATRDKVLRVIKELGYRPNAIARGLASRKTTTVGVVMADVTRASTSELLDGIADIAKKYNYSIKIFTMDINSDVEDAIRTVAAEQVDGILFLNDELSLDQMHIIHKYISDVGIPLVLSNAIFENEYFPSVSIDYTEAAYEVTRALIAAKRTKIYLLSTVHRYSVNEKKETGYTKAMAEAGLEPHIFRTSGDVMINTPQFIEFVKNNKFDAALAVRDSIAVSFMNVVINQGLKVPEDVMVIGMQNTKYAILARPQLTCIDTPVYDIGAASMQLLTRLMKNEPVNELKIILPHKIVRRGSM